MFSLEWHVAAVFVLLLSNPVPALALVSVAMWSATAIQAVRSAWQIWLPVGHPRWCRPLVAYLYVLQPILRGFHRVTYLLGKKRLPAIAAETQDRRLAGKRISATQRDVYWDSDEALGRELFLEEFVVAAKRAGWYGDFDNAWADWDVKLVGDRWHDITIRTATEELGWPRRFTRVRCSVTRTGFAHLTGTACLIGSVAAIFSLRVWALPISLIACTVLLASIFRSRRRCLQAVIALVYQAGEDAGLGSFPGKDAAGAKEQCKPLHHRLWLTPRRFSARSSQETPTRS